MIAGMSPEQAAFRARSELQLTSAAFDELRRRYLAEIMDAQTPEDGWRAILAMRSLNSVAQSLHSLIVTDDVNKHYEENPNG